MSRGIGRWNARRAWQRMRTVPGLGRDVAAVTVLVIVGLVTTAIIVKDQIGRLPWAGDQVTVKAEFGDAVAVKPAKSQQVRIAGVPVGTITGSTATGRAVMASAASTLKKVFLELGGKSAAIVLDGGDGAASLGAGVGMAAFSVCMHAGQGCALTTRLVVPRAHYDEAVSIAVATMSSVRIGDPTDPATICGPLISAVQRERVEGYLRSAVEDGGSFALGGGRPGGAGFERGFWIEPTVVAGLDNSARAAREEIFGPVLVVLAHDGDDDAVRIANDSPYGLSGSVTGPIDRARAVAARIRTGTLSVNGGVWFAADAPFGGYKQSGIGREMGVAGFEEYLQIKLLAEPA